MKKIVDQAGGIAPILFIKFVLYYSTICLTVADSLEENRAVLFPVTAFHVQAGV